MGPNQWQTSEQWPPAAETQRWYLTSGGRANTSAGDGRLVTGKPGAAGLDSYVYNPADPAPTTGGRHLLYFRPAGPQDQRELATRPDVLVYDSPALLADLAVAGPVQLELFVSSSAPTTDFHAALCEVHGDGRVLDVADGACRVTADADPLSERQIVIDFAHTAHTFGRGNRVRVQVTSSNFPRFDRNRNVGADRATGDYDIAVQHVLHGEPHPSALVLSIPDKAASDTVTN
jgi:putative CocE/NonD family hydrolase